MLKIKQVSDLHLEFSTLELPNKNGADVLVLGGDIVTAHNATAEDSPFGKRYRAFLKETVPQYKWVFAVAGNHEFYKGRFNASLVHLRAFYAQYGVEFLEQNHVVIDDVVFVGGTLWTDMNRGDPTTLFSIARMMNDYSQITYDGPNDNYRRLRPEDTVIRHKSLVAYIEETAKSYADRKVVVLTHHAPTKQSTKPRYKNDIIVNGAYSSDLSELMFNNPNIKLWTHGHTHDPFDYTVGSTRVVCNPRGYSGDGYDEKTGWNPDIILEV